MAGQILVSLRSDDRIEDIMPYITEVAKAGMSVIFLIRYPLSPWVWLQDHWVTTESSRSAMLVGREIIERYSLQREREVAEKILAPWHNVFRQMGVAATIDVYTGSWASKVKSYSRRGDISLIMRAHSVALTRFLRKAMAFSGFFKRVSFPPVLLLRPGQ